MLVADVSIMNGGGIRASFDAGEVTNGALQSVLPFDDAIAVALMKGDDLKRYLTTVIENHRLEGNGGSPHFAGIQAKFAKGKVTEIQEGIVTAKVVVDIGSGRYITSSVTMDAVRDLGIKAGSEVTAIIKASSVMLGVD